MKKLFTLCLVLGMTSVSFAGEETSYLRRSIERIARLSIQENFPSFEAQEKGVVPVTFKVRVLFDSLHKPQVFARKCTAVRVSDQYLLASTACIGTSTSINQFVSEKNGLGRMETVPVTGREILSVTVDEAQFTLPEQAIYSDAHTRLVLIRWENYNKPVQDKLGDLPISKIFIPQDPKSLAEVFPNPKVNRKSGPNVGGRVVSELEISSVSPEKESFFVNWEWLDAETGDPIFGVTENQEVFLLGFNLAERDGEYAKSGNQFSYFNQGTLPFLRRNMETQSFNALTKRIADERYFK